LFISRIVKSISAYRIMKSWTPEGQSLFIGAEIGEESFKEEYVANLVSTWCKENK
jgi:hypothetical protein